MLSVRLTISKDDPCLFITAVAKDRLPVFQTDAIKIITCKAIDEARKSCGFLLFAYVIMPVHFCSYDTVKTVNRASIYQRHCKSSGARILEGDEI